MTGCTVIYDPLACPVRHPFAMSPTDPVFFLPEVTLTAHIIDMIEINLFFITGN